MVAVIMALVSLLLLIQKGDAYEFKVGGSGDWSLTSTSYNQWAEKTRFQVGDTLYFKYQGEKDSVLEVSKEDYDNCNTASPIARHDDGRTVIKFDRSGSQYFISGVSDNCKNNEKVLIVVLADRTHKSSPQPPPSPASVSDESPSPPSDDKPPPSSPNGASSFAMSLLCCIGAFACFLSW
uniref:Early nodulin-like protein 1 n=1 Tax=Tanacetum cinerariifolium TaxID=118510 RepID=A0A6L2P7D8_TANCI|nr:early nodulin-like protein 1 [Tanacetum cinerariifolium]